MDVSVIVPCRGSAAYVPKIVEMLRAQDFRGEWEAVFVDDGDEDVSWHAIVESAGMRLLVRPRLGVSAARNAGLDASAGEIVLFVDADDEIDPGYVGRMYAAAEGVDFAWGDAEVVWEGGSASSTRSAGGPPAGSVLEGRSIRDFVWRRCFGYRLRNLAGLLLPGGMWRRCGRELAGVWARAFRRSAIGDLRFVEGLRNAEDSIFLCAFAARAATMRVSGPSGYIYRPRSDGALARENAGRNRLESKFALRDARRALDPGMSRWRGTYVLSALEVLRLGGVRAALRYLRWKPLQEAK